MKITFGELAEIWFQAKEPRLRPRTTAYYRSALDLVLLPRFSSVHIQAVDADAVVRLIRDLERDGLHALHPRRKRKPLGRSSVTNYLKPLHGILALAVRRRMIAANPFDMLMDDERPLPEEKRPAFEWSDEAGGGPACRIGGPGGDDDQQVRLHAGAPAGRGTRSGRARSSVSSGATSTRTAGT